MAPARILVVDDDSAILRLLRLTLSAEGYQVTTAATGEEGLERVDDAHPDLLLLDLLLPGIDGWEVLRRMRAKGENQPVIVITAGAVAHDALEGQVRVELLAKPFDIEHLLGRVEAHLARTAG